MISIGRKRKSRRTYSYSAVVYATRWRIVVDRSISSCWLVCLSLCVFVCLFICLYKHACLSSPMHVCMHVHRISVWMSSWFNISIKAKRLCTFVKDTSYIIMDVEESCCILYFLVVSYIRSVVVSFIVYFVCRSYLLSAVKTICWL